MNDILIRLPCGFDTTYGSLINGEEIIRCMMCDDEDLNVKDILNRPANRLRLKEKEIEIAIEYLNKLKNEAISIRKDPHFYVEQSFEKIFGELEIRREKLKQEFEKLIDDNYHEIYKDLNEKKVKIILGLEKSLNDIDNYNHEKTDFNNSKDLKEKIKLIETELKRVNEKSQEIKKIVTSSQYGKNFRLDYKEHNIDFKSLFGEIQCDLFDFREKSSLKDKFYDVTSLIEVDENRILIGSLSKIKLCDIKENKFLKEFKFIDNSYKLCLLTDELFASSNSNKIKIWNIKSGECERTLLGHQDKIWNLKLLSNGNLISCSSDKTIKIWNYKNVECLIIFNGHEGKVYDIEEGPNNTIISGSTDKTIIIWNIETGENLDTLKGHTSSIFCLKRINSNKLASGSADMTIKIWDLEKRECINTLIGHTGFVSKLDILKSGFLVSCSYDGTLRFWDIDINICLKIIQAHDGSIICFLFTKKEELVTGSYDEDKSLKIWSRF